MPYYAKINGTDIRVNLYSAAPTYYPTQDADGAACNLGSVSGGTATPFYANGTQIYIKPAGSWHTVWTGSQSLKVGIDPGDPSTAYGTTTISGLSHSITSSTPLKVYVTTTYGNSSWVDEDNEPVSFGESRKVGIKTGSCESSVWAPDYASSTSVTITARFDDQSGSLRLFPSIKATEIQAYY